MRGIPQGQYLRLRRNCSTIEAFKNEAQDLCNRFLERGYPDHVLRRAYHSALTRERTDLLTPGEDRCVKKDKNPIKNILRRHWKVLLLDPDIAEAVGPSHKLPIGEVEVSGTIWSKAILSPQLQKGLG